MNKNVEDKIDSLIEEAVHSNHPHLDKRKSQGYPGSVGIRKNRKDLAEAIKTHRSIGSNPGKHINPSAKPIISKFQDNLARKTSFSGQKQDLDKIDTQTIKRMQEKARSRTSAKK